MFTKKTRHINFVFLVLMIILLVSCQGTKHCIAIGGGSDKYGIDDASLEYCYSSDASALEKANVLVSNTGEKFFIVNKKYIEYANNAIKQNQNLKASSTTVDKDTTCLQEFCTLVKPK